MPGPHPFPERRTGDLAALRQILTELRSLHARADAAGSPALRALLSMAIATARDEVERAEAGQPRMVTRPADMLRRVGGDGE